MPRVGVLLQPWKGFLFLLFDVVAHRVGELLGLHAEVGFIAFLEHRIELKEQRVGFGGFVIQMRSLEFAAGDLVERGVD